MRVPLLKKEVAHINGMLKRQIKPETQLKKKNDYHNHKLYDL